MASRATKATAFGNRIAESMERAKNATKNFSIETRALQNRIAEAGGGIGSLNALLTQMKIEQEALAESTQKTTTAFSGLSNLLSPMGFGILSLNIGMGIMAATLVTSVIGAFEQAITKGTEFELSLAQLQALSGESTVTIGRLADEMFVLAKSQGFFDVLELSRGFRSLAAAGVEASQSTSVLRNAMNVALVTGQDLQTQTLQLVNISNEFGISLANTAKTADIIAKAESLGTITSAQFSLALAESGGLARAAGISIEDASAAIILFANNSGLAGEAGTFLRRVFKDLLAESEPLRKNARALGVEFQSLPQFINDLRDTQHRLGLSTGEFVSKLTNEVKITVALTTLLDTLPGKQEKISASLKERGAAQEKANIITNSAVGQLKQAQKELDAESVSFGRTTLAAQTFVTRLGFASVLLGEKLIGAVQSGASAIEFFGTSLAVATARGDEFIGILGNLGNVMNEIAKKRAHDAFIASLVGPPPGLDRSLVAIPPTPGTGRFAPLKTSTKDMDDFNKVLQTSIELFRAEHDATVNFLAIDAAEWFRKLKDKTVPADKAIDEITKRFIELHLILPTVTAQDFQNLIEKLSEVGKAVKQDVFDIDEFIASFKKLKAPDILEIRDKAKQLNKEFVIGTIGVDAFNQKILSAVEAATGLNQPDLIKFLNGLTSVERLKQWDIWINTIFIGNQSLRELGVTAQELQKIIISTFSNMQNLANDLAKSIIDLMTNFKSFIITTPEGGLITGNAIGGQNPNDVFALSQRFLNEAEHADLIGDHVRAAQLRAEGQRLSDLGNQLRQEGAGEIVIGTPAPTPGGHVEEGEPSNLGPGGSVKFNMQSGGTGIVNEPTLFMAGEAGPEPFAFGKDFVGARNTFNININNPVVRSDQDIRTITKAVGDELLRVITKRRGANLSNSFG